MIVCPASSPHWSHGRKRRSHYDSPVGSDVSLSSEASPLEVDANLSSYTYSTFRSRDLPPKQREPVPYWWLFFNGYDVRKTPRPMYSLAGRSARYDYEAVSHGTSNGHFQRPPLGCSWKVLYTTLFLVGLLAVYCNHFQTQDDNPYHHYYTKPESMWDHNIYMPKNEAHDASHTHTTGALLVAQLSLGSLTDISSRPNRAYARQHGLDYVRYATGGRSSFIKKACFDKVILLNLILDKQLRDNSRQEHLMPPSIFSLPQRIEYDALALLSPDSIVTNLDCNIFDLLPKDKLVAIAGWKNHTSIEPSSPQDIFSKTDVIFFNLRHKHANAVAKLWWDWVEPPEVSCGAGNDLTLLADAISSVLEEGEDLSSVIAPLVETDKGFVSRGGAAGTAVQERVMKGIVKTVPESRALMLLNNLPGVRVTLQTTVDSVCYRYYPRCEVL